MKAFDIVHQGNGETRNLPLPTTLWVVPLLLLLLVALLTVGIIGILAPLGPGCTVHFVKLSVRQLSKDGIMSNGFDGTCLERVDRSRQL